MLQTMAIPRLPMLLLLLLLHQAADVAGAGSGSLGAYRVNSAQKDTKLNAGCRIGNGQRLNMTSLCAASCHAVASCQSFSFSEAAGECELYKGAAGVAACNSVTANGWLHFLRNGFQMPQPVVGACQIGTECKNSGICLSRTEVAENSMVCACKQGFKGETCETEEAKPEWSAWSDFGSCSVTCGVGLKMRSRQCQASGSQVKPDLCGSGSPEEYRMCNTTVCPSWSSWSSWSACSTVSSCGQGVRQRSRSCSNGGAIGKDCLGSSVENTPCESVSCGIDNAPVSLQPINYEPYSVGKGFVRIYNDLYAAEGYVCADGFGDEEGRVVCSSLGFEGVQTEPVTAPAMPTSPAPTYFLTNLNCQGTEGSLQMCQHAGWSNETACSSNAAAYVVCKVNGRWSQWSQWESCDGKCGSAMRNRTRTCNQPKPLGGGQACVGLAFNESPCPSLSPCPVDGTWQQWSQWSACSVTCGGGSTNRSRLCKQPLHGGRDCDGPANQNEVCNTLPCPVDGYYKQWSEWNSCSATCGGGQQQRSRVCVQPQHNGKECEGPTTETKACSINSCPVDGKWSTWTAWGSCNVSCGGGSSQRARLCNNPQPQHGGADCVGVSLETRGCNSQHCPINGFYGNWAAWSECSKTCGGGTHVRSRSCTPPQHGGADCQGEASQTASCNDQPCPIDGVWHDWSQWSSCNATCGTAVRTRGRDCDEPKFGGRQCEGDAMQVQACTLQHCPVNCLWSEWSGWSQCSVTCGGSQQQRQRTIVTAAAHGGNGCQGNSDEVQACGQQDCGLLGQWTDWSPWSPCSVTCNSGTRSRSRSCQRQDPVRPMLPCPGSEAQTENCHEFHCRPRATNCAEWRRRGLTASARVDIQPASIEVSAYCNATDNSTVLGHSLDRNETTVHGFEGFGSFRIMLQYDGGFDTAVALANVAIGCKQFLRLRCLNSLKNVLNQPGQVMTWWNNKNGAKMHSWGSVANNRTACSCSTDGSCAKADLLCNCDANDGVWREDSGYIPDSDLLPVSSVQVGDTGNSSEYSKILVGPLICWH